MKRIDPEKTAPKTELTITETAEHLGVSRASVYNLIKDKRLKTVRRSDKTYVKFKKEKKNVD